MNRGVGVCECGRTCFHDNSRLMITRLSPFQALPQFVLLYRGRAGVRSGWIRDGCILVRRHIGEDTQDCTCTQGVAVRNCTVKR